MKCPRCGFIHGDGIITGDQFLCKLWGHLYSMNNKILPTKEQFEAMQREGFLPFQEAASDGSSRTYALTHGHYGYGVLHDWPAIAAKVLATT